MKYRIVRYMTNWAIKQRRWFFWWEIIRHGDYWPAADRGLQGKVIEFESEEKANTWMKQVLWVRRVN